MARLLRVLLVVVLAGAGLACSSGSATAGRPVTVFAAASLTDPFTDAKPALLPGLDVTYDFAGSQSLVQAVEQHAPADVIATADMVTMQTLVDDGLVERPVVFARNRLELLVRPGNPKHVEQLADLARPDLTVVLCDKTVPAGNYSAQVLARADVQVDAKSFEPDVKSAVQRVVSGEADATIVYVTDVRAAGDRGTGVTIPDSDNAVAEYPLAIVKATAHRDAAAAFVEQVRTGAVRDALRARGFDV